MFGLHVLQEPLLCATDVELLLEGLDDPFASVKRLRKVNVGFTQKLNVCSTQMVKVGFTQMVNQVYFTQW